MLQHIQNSLVIRVLGRLKYRVTVVEFRMYSRSGDGVGCFEVKVETNAA